LGAILGLAYAQPIVIVGVVSIAFLGLLILILIVHWLPLIEFLNEKDPNEQDLIVADHGGSNTRHFRAQENRIWVAFLVGTITYVSSIVVFATHLPPDSLLRTLGSYASALLTMLILSPLIVLWMSIFLGKKNPSAEKTNGIALRCLIRFQIRGWIVLLLFLLVLVPGQINW
jgi:hypothetical protein